MSVNEILEESTQLTRIVFVVGVASNGFRRVCVGEIMIKVMALSEFLLQESARNLKKSVMESKYI